MPRQLWIADVLADAFRGMKGVKVEAYSGWDERGSTSFDPFGVLNHHTGPGAYDPLLKYMMEIASIKPSCNWATSRPVNGVVRVTVCCAGRANHAGKGGGFKLPSGDFIPLNDGNKKLIGGEHQNDGKQPWPDLQDDVIAIGSAALLKHMGKDERNALDHKDYAPGRKPDRHTITLAQGRAKIKRYLDEAPRLEHTDLGEMEDLMALLAKSREDAAELFVRKTFDELRLRAPSADELQWFITRTLNEGVSAVWTTIRDEQESQDILLKRRQDVGLTG